ncbi:MAG: hypothetical protein Q7V57_11135 [Actinomycetota bacterium]|nr:hypothetical protein [Actinomycetota bacterium]
MPHIHKYNVARRPEEAGLGLHTIPGIARTIGVDTAGDLVVWYEEHPADKHDFVVAFTGEDLDPRYQVVDTTVWSGLVWHLAVPRG